ncbi:MAG: cytochrome o ubiquinol oxidase subunit III [Parachlamydia sp.]|jgi:cytochrome o ubiquinol oxidase subunit 3|nr:cytochrome o ubiquinol oxidase subunit III [Parachlamydia sp.]
MEAVHSLTKDSGDAKTFGFWVYLMTDLIIFACLFACYIVLRNNTYGGPTAKELYEMPFVLAETLILLFSSFTCSLAMLAAERNVKNWAMGWLIITFLLGAAFLFLEIKEFTHFVEIGANWQRSAFLSSFFTLLGTHGLHITTGLLWIAVMLVRLAIRPLNGHSLSQLHRMSLFWHFLDFVWIFIFTIVYGMGILI